MMKELPFMKVKSKGSACLILLAAVLATGCGSGKSSDPPATASKAGALNSYVGTEGTANPSASPPLFDATWQITVNHNTNSFSATDFSLPSGTGNSNGTTFNGVFTFDAGFLNFAQTNVNGNAFQPGGFMIEIPGRIAFLRPDYFTTQFQAQPPVVAVPSSCLNINGNAAFQFVALPNTNWNSATDTAYGGLQVSVSADKTTWSLSNLAQFTLSKSSQSGASLSPGICTASLAGTVVSIPPSSTTGISTNLAVGPSGFLIMNQGTSSVVGMIPPTSPLNTGSLVGVNYLGFVSEPNLPFPNSNIVGTVNQITSFGPSGAGLVGGAFPVLSTCTVLGTPSDVCDDPTQPAATDLTINLGTENSINNGLYDSATVTIPDPNLLCAPPGVSGTDANGNPTCTVPAVAIAGNPENKFVIFLVAQDIVNNSPLAIYLLQQ
jgi:hypothetical protein